MTESQRAIINEIANTYPAAKVRPYGDGLLITIGETTRLVSLFEADALLKYLPCSQDEAAEHLILFAQRGVP